MDVAALPRGSGRCSLWDAGEYDGERRKDEADEQRRKSRLAAGDAAAPVEKPPCDAFRCSP